MMHRHRSRRARSGFTLVETLISIALLAGFLVAAVTILFQISSAWASQADDPVIDRHVEGLGRFVRGVVARGVTAPPAERVSSEGAILESRAYGDLPMFSDRATVGGEITARFAVSPEGAFVLCWNTAGEYRRSRAISHKTLLSNWVTSAKIFVYDEMNKKWTEFVPTGSSEGFGGQNALRVLRLEIEHLGQRRVLEILLPRSRT